MGKRTRLVNMKIKRLLCLLCALVMGVGLFTGCSSEAEQKKEFMDDYTARRQKSKKALLILVPMIATFFLEVLDIYVLQGILSYLQK